MQITNHIIRHVQSLFARLNLEEKRLLLAVSGGADSMALAYIVSQAAGPANCYAVTVDHGFRPESAHEARAVGRYMRELGISHEIRKLRWRSGGICDSDNKDTAAALLPPVQKMEEVARERRYIELGKVCQAQNVHAVLTGHHADDQAETFLLRFLCQSGIYGMSGMPVQTEPPFAWISQGLPSQSWPKPVLVRPLLQTSKRAIYELCEARGIQWHEDPSNADIRFRRNKLRQLIGSRSNNAESPFSRPSLLDMCGAMQRHRGYISKKVAELLSAHSKLDMTTGTAELSAQVDGGSHKSMALPSWARNTALRERILASVVGWVGGRSHPPELSHLNQFMDAIVDYYKNASNRGFSPVSVAGVSLYPPSAKGGWLFCRQRPRAGEIKECIGHSLDESIVWDGRLVVSMRRRGYGDDDAAAAAALPSAVADMRWSVIALADCATQPWNTEIDKHRRLVRKARKRLETAAVQATQPVVCVEVPRMRNTPSAAPLRRPVFALGHAIAGALDKDSLCVDVDVRMLCETANPGASEEIVVAPELSLMQATRIA